MPQRQMKLVAMARELAQDFAMRAAEHDRANSFPFENIERMKETGYTALVVPEQYGGLGAGLVDYVLCQEALAQGCAPTALAINMHLFGIGSMVERMRGTPSDVLFLETIGRGRSILGGE